LATIFGPNTYFYTGVRKVADNLKQEIKWSHGVMDARVQGKCFYVVCSCHMIHCGLHGFGVLKCIIESVDSVCRDSVDTQYMLTRIKNVKNVTRCT